MLTDVLRNLGFDLNLNFVNFSSIVSFFFDSILFSVSKKAKNTLIPLTFIYTNKVITSISLPL